MAGERERIMKLSRMEAIREVLDWHRLDSRERAIKAIKENGLLDII